MATLTKKIHRMVCCGAVSYLALSVHAASNAYAESVSIPPVTVQAPERQTVRRAQPQRGATRTRVTIPSVPAPVAPVPYLTPTTGMLGGLPAPYAGGQVATGGQLGMLGNRGVMDTPFSQTSYTAKLIQDQQARTVADVLQNDPSVRIKTPDGNGIAGLYIRGFYYDSGDFALNGLYGIAPFYSTGANFVERVEVLKGPSALLSGMPPAGSIGGSVNIVTKTARDFDITQLTATYASKSQFGANVDLSRRYGERKEFGIRFNGGYRNGATAYDRQTDEFGDAALNLDYRGENVRWSADLGYQAQDLSPPLRFMTLLSSPPFPPAFGTIPVPPAPSAGTNYMPSWATWKPKDTFAMTQGEIDLTDSVTAYGKFGYHRSTVDFLFTSPIVTNIPYAAIPNVGPLGNFQARPFKGTDIYDSYAGEAGIRASVDIGPVNHFLTVNYSAVDRTYDQFNLWAPPPPVVSNIYNPVDIPLPTNFSPIVSLESRTNLSSVGFADVMSLFNKRVQVIVGARRQTAGAETINALAPANSSSVKDAIWSPAYALIVKPFENVSVYANYIEGLKAPEAVTDANLYSNIGAILPAFQTKQKEVGIKVDMGRITTTVSAFEITNPNTIPVPVPGKAPALELSGEQINRGIEVYVFGEVSPTVRLLGGVTLIDGKVVKGAADNGIDVVNFDGKTPVGVSKVNVNLYGEWDTPFVRDLTLTGRVIYTSESFANQINTQVLPEWTRVDLGARYTFASPWNGKPIVVRANVENVFNAAYWQSYHTVSSAVSLAAPRTYLVSTTFNF
jgi:iron complex outermembrane recepter protein